MRSERRNRASWRALVFFLAGCAVLLGLPAEGRTYTFGTNVKALGAEQTVFDWTKNRCEDDDIPDLPARAFRDFSGRTQLIATHWVNHRYVGTDLNGVQHSCATLIRSGNDPNPAAYNAYQWLAAPYTVAGET